jgi:hypothetical protein
MVGIWEGLQIGSPQNLRNRLSCAISAEHFGH